MLDRQTAFVDDTEILSFTGACRLKAVVVDLPDTGDAESFIQFWDNADPDPGTTAPRMVLPVPFIDNGSASVGSKRRYKFVFPGGYPFGTALAWLPTTTHDGQTATTSDEITAVEVHYERQ